jgi:hypothetical protein
MQDIGNWHLCRPPQYISATRLRVLCAATVDDLKSLLRRVMEVAVNVFAAIVLRGEEILEVGAAVGEYALRAKLPPSRCRPTLNQRLKK